MNCGIWIYIYICLIPKCVRVPLHAMLISVVGMSQKSTERHSLTYIWCFLLCLNLLTSFALPFSCISLSGRAGFTNLSTYSIVSDPLPRSDIGRTKASNGKLFSSHSNTELWAVTSWNTFEKAYVVVSRNRCCDQLLLAVMGMGGENTCAIYLLSLTLAIPNSTPDERRVKCTSMSVICTYRLSQASS